MKSHPFIRIISILLICAVMLQILPTNRAIALEAEENLAQEVINAGEDEVISSDEGEALKIVGEVESLRDEKDKHFRLEDGS